MTGRETKKMLCSTYKGKINIQRKHGQTEEEGLEHLCEQCVFRGCNAAGSGVNSSALWTTKRRNPQ